MSFATARRNKTDMQIWCAFELKLTLGYMSLFLTNCWLWVSTRVSFYYFENFSFAFSTQIIHTTLGTNSVVMWLPTKTVFLNKEHVLLYYWTCQLLFIYSNFVCLPGNPFYCDCAWLWRLVLSSCKVWNENLLCCIVRTTDLLEKQLNTSVCSELSYLDLKPIKTIFKVLYLQLHLVLKTRNAKSAWQHTIDMFILDA